MRKLNVHRWCVALILAHVAQLSQTHPTQCEPIICRDGPLSFVDRSPELVKHVERGKYLELPCRTHTDQSCYTEWLKNGNMSFPFDLRAGESLFHTFLEPPCDNHTLVFRNSQKDATGNYTCIVHNNNTSIQRTYEVTVLDTPYDGDPIPVDNKNCTNMTVSKGQDVYVYCEFCVGDKASLTDLQWFRETNEVVDGEEKVQRVPISDLKCHPEPVVHDQYEVTCKHSRDCDFEYTEPASIGKGLIFRAITPDLYGWYTLSANYTLNGVSKKASISLQIQEAPFPTQTITIIIVVSLALVFLISATVTAVAYNYHLTAMLYWKNRFGKVEDDDGHEYDAFISYSDEYPDRTLAIYLSQCLQEHGYSVWVRDLDSVFSSTLIADEIESMKKSRRSILIVSPDYSQSAHSGVLTELAADQTLKDKSQIIPVLYRGARREHISIQPRLVEIIRVLPCLTWEESGPPAIHRGDASTHTAHMGESPAPTSLVGDGSPPSAHVGNSSTSSAHVGESSPSIGHGGDRSAPIDNVDDSTSPASHVGDHSPSTVHAGETSPPTVHLTEDSLATVHLGEDSPPIVHLGEDSPPIVHIGNSYHGDRNQSVDDGEALMRDTCDDQVQLVGSDNQLSRKNRIMRDKFVKKLLLKMPPKRVATVVYHHEV